MRKIKKIFYVILRGFIKLIDGFSPRLYMRFYNWYLQHIGVDLYGCPRYIHPSVDFDGKGYEKIHIGDNVVISKNVLLLIHDYSINCGLRSINKNEENHEAYWIKEIFIGNNVFIGANVSVLPGTKIGDNSIIGTGSVVKGDISENSIVIGNPSKIVGNTIDWTYKKMENRDYFFE